MTQNTNIFFINTSIQLQDNPMDIFDQDDQEISIFNEKTR